MTRRMGDIIPPPLDTCRVWGPKASAHFGNLLLLGVARGAAVHCQKGRQRLAAEFRKLRRLGVAAVPVHEMGSIGRMPRQVVTTT